MAILKQQLGAHAEVARLRGHDSASVQGSLREECHACALPANPSFQHAVTIDFLQPDHGQPTSGYPVSNNFVKDLSAYQLGCWEPLPETK